MGKEKKEVDADVKRANLSFIQLIFPTFLLLIIPSNIGGNTFYPLVLKGILFVYQYFITSHFVNSIYK